MGMTLRPKVEVVWPVMGRVLTALTAMLLVGLGANLGLRAAWEDWDEARVQSATLQEFQVGIASASLALDDALEAIVADPEVVETLPADDRGQALVVQRAGAPTHPNSAA